MRVSQPRILRRLKCRRVGHDWGQWHQSTRGLLIERACTHCETVELRHLGVRIWDDKRWFVRAGLLGRLVEWHA